MADYLRAFIIGSSLPVFGFYFYKVASFEEQGLIKCSYPNYTLVAPLFLGLLNTFGLWFSKTYGLTSHMRFILTALLGTTIVSIFITAFNIYPYTTPEEWVRHYAGLLVVYLAIFGLIVYWIDHELKC